MNIPPKNEASLIQYIMTSLVQKQNDGSKKAFFYLLLLPFSYVDCKNRNIHFLPLPNIPHFSVVTIHRSAFPNYLKLTDQKILRL